MCYQINVSQRFTLCPELMGRSQRRTRNKTEGLAVMRVGKKGCNKKHVKAIFSGAKVLVSQRHDLIVLILRLNVRRIQIGTLQCII